MEATNNSTPTTCPNCHGYLIMPTFWSGTIAPRMCTCSIPRYDLSWECTRCKKINAPWKDSCNCTPSPFGNYPITGSAGAPIPCQANLYVAGPNKYTQTYTS